MFPYKAKGWYGIVEADGSVVVEAARYAHVGFFENGSTVYSLPGGAGHGIWRAHREHAAPRDAAYLFSVHDSLCLAQDDDYLCGYVDLEGNWEIPKRYHQARDFRMGYARAALERNGKFGLLDRTGAMVMEPVYDHIDAFTAGGAAAKLGERWHLIRPDLGVLDCGEVARVHAPSGGLLLRERRGRTAMEYDFLDMDLQPALGGVKFQGARGWSEGKCGVKLKGKGWCFIGPDGVPAVEGYFSDVGRFFNGISPARAAGKGGKWGAVDTGGAWVVPPLYQGVEHVSPFSRENTEVDGRLLLVWKGDYVVGNGGMGYYDYAGNVVVEVKR